MVTEYQKFVHNVLGVLRVFLRVDEYEIVKIENLMRDKRNDGFYVSARTAYMLIDEMLKHRCTCHDVRAFVHHYSNSPTHEYGICLDFVASARQCRLHFWTKDEN